MSRWLRREARAELVRGVRGRFSLHSEFPRARAGSHQRRTAAAQLASRAEPPPGGSARGRAPPASANCAAAGDFWFLTRQGEAFLGLSRGGRGCGVGAPPDTIWTRPLWRSNPVKTSFSP